MSGIEISTLIEESIAPYLWTWGAKILQLISTKSIGALIWTFLVIQSFFSICVNFRVWVPVGAGGGLAGSNFC